MLSIVSLDSAAREVAAEAPFSRAGASPARIRRAVERARPTPLAHPLARVGKRTFDILCAAVLLVCLSPLMILVALHVRRDGGPALFRQNRLGVAGRGFRCLKFRSMQVDADEVLADLLANNPSAAAEWDTTQKLCRDPRITEIGHVIRTTSIDELPQLLNVLRGEMSLVGPRPIVTSELRHYGPHADTYALVKPGLTGLWQISGRSNTTYQQRVQLDTDYIRNWTFWLDIAILVKTIPVIVLRRGAV